MLVYDNVNIFAALSLPFYGVVTQAYHTPVSAVNSTVQQFSRCLHDVEAWISASRLRLNPSKTVVLWLGSRHVIDKLDVHEVQVLSSTVKIDSSARDLGVVVENRLTMSDHVASVSYTHLTLPTNREV